MAPRLPSRVTPSTPTVFKGEIYNAVGKYARGAVLHAFEQIGGTEGLGQWAELNKDDFYTKLFPKIIARESEVQHVRSVDDIMDLLDADYDVVEDAEVVPETHPQRPTIMDSHWGDEPPTSFGDDDEIDLDAWDIDNFVEFPDD